jgi:integrase
MPQFKRPKPFAISIDELYNLGQQLKDQEQQALYYTLYLTAARVSEALQLQKRDVWKGIDKDKEALIFRVITSKTKDSPPRNLPVYLDGIEKEMALAVWSWRDTKLNEDDKLFHFSRRRAGNIIATLRINVRVIMPDNTYSELLDFNLYPHYLRHCRLTYLITEKHYDLHSLMQFAGWKEVNMANTYAKLDWRDLLRKQAEE